MAARLGGLRRARARRRVAPIPAHTGDITRFANADHYASYTGTASIEVSSGEKRRQRLDQGGNRQINAALHRVIFTRARCHPATQDYIARRRAERKTTREAIRCLKRYLARHVWRLLEPPHPDRGTPPAPSIS